MSSSMTSRLAQLCEMVESDIAKLPDRPVSPQEDDVGGVPIHVTAYPQQVDLAEATVDKQPAGVGQEEATAPFISPKENAERRFVWIQGAVSSYNSGAASTPSTLPTGKLPPTTLRKGDLTPASRSFCPILALAKYPYKFCNSRYMQDIASRFFDGGKFWAREWDLFYVHDAEEGNTLILVSEHQFESLLQEINSVFDFGLRITDKQIADGLVGGFPDHPSCRPRYLGRSNTREDYDNMTANVPGKTFRAPGEGAPPPLDGRDLQAFKQVMEDMWDAQKNKSKALKEKKQQERAVKQQSLIQQFKRASRYLGLRASQPGVSPCVEPTLPVPFPFDQSVVFICVDVESYEKAHDKITEIGIATLDTSELLGVPPGVDGANWRSKIRARHFRVEEYKTLVNSEFVSGCPDRFEFGESEFVRLQKAPAEVGACFKQPFCADSQPGDDSHRTKSLIDLEEPRKLIFLGHDTLADVRYLQKLGFDPLKLPNLVEALDTASLYRVWKREPNPTALGKILYDFDIIGWNLHNAGNDAVYTVQAMLAVCVREATLRGSVQLAAKRDKDQAAKLASLTADAQQRVQDEALGWSETEDNGGPPESIVIREKPKPLSEADHARYSNLAMRTKESVSFSLDEPRHTESRRERGRGHFRERGRGGQQTSASLSKRTNDYEYTGTIHTSGRDKGNRDTVNLRRIQSQGSYGGRSEHSGSRRGRGRGRGRDDETPQVQDYNYAIQQSEDTTGAKVSHTLVDIP